jgi:hypothetical protein
MRKTLVVGEMALREIGRRRSVLIILLLFPLAFYLSRHGDHLGQSIRFVIFGLGWAISTAALFAGNAARSIEPRLRLSGYATHQLFLGRLGALWALGLTLSVPYFVLILFDQRDIRFGAVALIMVLMALVAAPFGLMISSLLPRELEGALVLLVVFGVQMIMDPSSFAARLLPFWFSREIGTYAIDLTGRDYLLRGLLHAGITLVVTLAVVAISASRRLRRRSHVKLA